MRNFFREYVSEFEKLTNDLPNRTGGISRSEAFAFCALCKLFDIDMVIDSGTGRGVSGEYFARTLDNIFTIDHHKHYDNSLEISSKRLQKYKNLTFIVDDAVKVIPHLLQTIEHKKCAIFFDGPKGEIAFNFYKKQQFNTVFVGFHDVAPDSKEWKFFEGQDGIILNTSYGWFPEEYNRLNENRIITPGFLNGPGAVFWSEELS